MLAASVVISTGVPSYVVSNANVTSRVDEILPGNRGGIPAGGTHEYTTTIEYGTYSAGAQGSYIYSMMAQEYGGSWHYSTPYLSSAFVPASLDAVRVTTQVQSPTTFARTLGISGIPVQAVAAAVLRPVQKHIPQGPTWPMTNVAFSSPNPALGICRPFIFSSTSTSYPNTAGFFNLVQLGAHQGTGYEDSHMQLLTGPDTRAPVADATFSMAPCGNAGWAGHWSPAGNCTNPISYPPAGYGDQCCNSGHNAIGVDIPNWIMNDFKGLISLNSTSWRDANGNYHDWRGPDNPDTVGDWLEAYDGITTNVQPWVHQYIATYGTNDQMAPYFGKHVDKVMYLYDLKEQWRVVYNPDNTLCDPFLYPPCSWAWQATAGDPGRVHVAQPMVFRFYERMASPTGFSTPAGLCGTGATFGAPNAEVYGVFAGQDLTDCQAGCNGTPGSHGLYNIVSLVDAAGTAP